MTSDLPYSCQIARSLASLLACITLCETNDTLRCATIWVVVLYGSKKSNGRGVNCSSAMSKAPLCLGFLIRVSGTVTGGSKRKPGANATQICMQIATCSLLTLECSGLPYIYIYPQTFQHSWYQGKEFLYDFECGHLYDYECGTLNDYECRSYVATNVAVYNFTSVAGDEECAAKFFGCPAFLNIMLFCDFWAPPIFSDVPFFPNGMNFSNIKNSSVPPNVGFD